MHQDNLKHMTQDQITIQSILKPELTCCKLPGSSKKKVLETIAHFVAERTSHLDEELIYDSLISREKLGSTGIGQGIAIPHSRLENCHRVIGCLFTLEQFVDFESIDNEPVDLLFVLFVPLDATSEHLQLLSQIAEKFNNQTLCKKLRDAKDSESLFQTMITS